MFNAPIFVLTSDVDWASEYCISNFVDKCNLFGFRPTLFATHKSKAIDNYINDDAISIGLHPNFLPSSTHGDSVEKVVDRVMSFYPGATCFRSHSFVDSSYIQREFLSRGVHYDSNICLYMQQDIGMLQTAWGVRRYPVFWEDDVHWNQVRGEIWDFSRYEAIFSTPGLKIVNFHPFNVAANLSTHEEYLARKSMIQVFDESGADAQPRKEGVESFLLQMLTFLRRTGARVMTLDEVDDLYRESQPGGLDVGRVSVHSDDIVEAYGKSSVAEKKEILKKSFSQRNAEDIYATSRDFNLRELEISSISAHLPKEGYVLDLGCGNGYSIISLAKRHFGYNFVGVDYSDNLIAGANKLLSQAEVKSSVTFHCSEVFQYLNDVKEDTYDGVITERLIQNLPDKQQQYSLLLEIYRVLKPNGLLLMCEASHNGFHALNSLRKGVGLSEIPSVYNSNFACIHIVDEDLENFASSKGFKLINKAGYSTYYVCSRVLHPAVISPRPPKFDSIFNHYAMKIQMGMPFQSGIGAETLWVFEKN